jgi:hypothetical protein
MTRVLLTAAVLLLSVVAVEGAGASHTPAGGGPPVDFAAGGGKYLLDLPGLLQFRVGFAFSARRDARSLQPSAATGHFLWRDRVNDQFIRGEIVCLQVDGGRAFMVSEIVDTDDPVNLGLFAGARVVDSGLPGGMGDEFHLDFVSFPFPGMCDAPAEEFAFDVVAGNVVVHDASFEPR